MFSNRTASFKTNEKEDIKKPPEENFVKLYTTPLPKFDMNFHFKDEKEIEESSFSFQNDLLSKNAYNFLKKKDECLATMILDDTVSTKNQENIKNIVFEIREKNKYKIYMDNIYVNVFESMYFIYLKKYVIDFTFI